MPGDVQSTPWRLTDAQIEAYRKQARRTLLGGGYNLFAEITLQLIENYYAQLAEAENISRVRVAQARQAERLAQENQALREQVASLDDEKRQLLERIEQQQHEIERLQRGKINMPPSWE